MTEIEPYQPPAAQWIEVMGPAWELAKRLERAKEFIPAEFNNRAEAIMAAILTGGELGQGPMWSLRTMHVVNGKPGLSAEGMRALVLAAGHEIAVTELADHQVTMVGRRRGAEHSTTVTWTIAQAEKAGLMRNQVWKSYPRAMLTARATTELCRLVFADVIAGIATTEELEDGYPLGPAPEQPPASVRRGRRPRPSSPVATGQVTSGVGTPGKVGDPASRPPAGPPLPGEPGYELVAVDPATAAAAVEVGDAGEYEAAKTVLRVIPDAELVPETDPDFEPDYTAREEADAARRKLMALTRDAFPALRQTEREQYRHALTAVVTRDRPDGPEVSSTRLTTEERLDLTLRLDEVKSGALLPSREPDGTIVFASQTKNAIATPPADDHGRWTVEIKER